MNQITDVLRDSKRLRLIATALELLQYEKIDSAVIPIPGTEPQRYVAIGTAATVARLLEIAPAGQAVTQQAAPDEFSDEEIAGWQQSALNGVLSRRGWQRYRNGDPLELNPSDLRDLMDLAVGSAFANRDRISDLAPTTSTVSASQVDQSMALPSHTAAEWAADHSEGGHHD